MSDSEPQMPDMSALLAQAQQMSEQLMAQQSAAQATEIEGHAGGGAVVVRMTGGGEFLSVKIAPSAVDPDDVEMLEDLVLAALNDAVANAAVKMPRRRNEDEPNGPRVREIPGARRVAVGRGCAVRDPGRPPCGAPRPRRVRLHDAGPLEPRLRVPVGRHLG